MFATQCRLLIRNPNTLLNVFKYTPAIPIQSITSLNYPKSLVDLDTSNFNTRSYANVNITTRQEKAHRKFLKNRGLLHKREKFSKEQRQQIANRTARPPIPDLTREQCANIYDQLLIVKEHLGQKPKISVYYQFLNLSSTREELIEFLEYAKKLQGYCIPGTDLHQAAKQYITVADRLQSPDILFPILKYNLTHAPAQFRIYPTPNMSAEFLQSLLKHNFKEEAREWLNVQREYRYHVKYIAPQSFFTMIDEVMPDSTKLSDEDWSYIKPVILDTINDERATKHYKKILEIQNRAFMQAIDQGDVSFAEELWQNLTVNYYKSRSDYKKKIELQANIELLPSDIPSTFVKDDEKFGYCSTPMLRAAASAMIATHLCLNFDAKAANKYANYYIWFNRAAETSKHLCTELYDSFFVQLTDTLQLDEVKQAITKFVTQKSIWSKLNDATKDKFATTYDKATFEAIFKERIAQLESHKQTLEAAKPEAEKAQVEAEQNLKQYVANNEKPSSDSKDEQQTNEIINKFDEILAKIKKENEAENKEIKAKVQQFKDILSLPRKEQRAYERSKLNKANYEKLLNFLEQSNFNEINVTELSFNIKKLSLQNIITAYARKEVKLLNLAIDNNSKCQSLFKEEMSKFC